MTMSQRRRRWEMANGLVIESTATEKPVVVEVKTEKPEVVEPKIEIKVNEAKAEKPKAEPKIEIKVEEPKGETTAKKVEKKPERSKASKSTQPKAAEKSTETQMAEIRAMLEKVCVKHAETLENHSKVITEFDHTLGDHDYRLSRLERTMSQLLESETVIEAGEEVQIKMALEDFKHEGQGLFTVTFKAVE